ncbi:unnamed protein product [Notodromas monacha]|uniref:Uncharacterized protein n=1 Tax=Notodromas monacha TaxID=399045 RepID=A0A7R9BRA6_9CRUS|nr:unnamed protein product [Notodromas monacha]CAG0920219.1 unnamed protein product [Notodromas monacha]
MLTLPNEKPKYILQNGHCGSTELCLASWSSVSIFMPIIILFVTLEESEAPKQPLAEKRRGFTRNLGTPMSKVTHLTSVACKAVQYSSDGLYDRGLITGATDPGRKVNWSSFQAAIFKRESVGRFDFCLGGRDADSDLILPPSFDADYSDGVEWESRNKKPGLRMYADELIPIFIL